MCTSCITPLAKWLCDTPLGLLTLKFHDLHPFLIYTPTPSAYTHPIFNCVVNEKRDVGTSLKSTETRDELSILYLESEINICSVRMPVNA